MPYLLRFKRDCKGSDEDLATSLGFATEFRILQEPSLGFATFIKLAQTLHYIVTVYLPDSWSNDCCVIQYIG